MKISEIQTGVPVPSPLHNCKYPMNEMDIGDCFILTPEDDETPRLLSRRVAPTVAKYGKQQGKKFRTRTLPDGTIGVWRTE